MEFNAKFFLVAICLSLISEALQIIFTLLSFLSLWPISTFSWIWLGLAPLQLLLGTVLSFAVMYILSTRASTELPLRPIMVSTFLGCWIGQLASLFITTSLTYIAAGGYSDAYLLYVVLSTLWQTFALALSPTFFTSLAAILLVHYQKTAVNSQTPTTPPTTTTPETPPSPQSY